MSKQKLKKSLLKVKNVGLHYISVQDFGLDVEAFQRMVEDCPLDFLEMAISCCNVRNDLLTAHQFLFSIFKPYV